MKPYKDFKNVRVFDSTVSSDLYVWHRDHKDRSIKIESGQGWRLQYNGSLPIELIEGKTYTIPCGLYHRLLKGFTDLTIQITEHD